MDKAQILEVLQSCLLATDGADMDYLVEKGIKPLHAKWGLRLYSYLKKRET